MQDDSDKESQKSNGSAEEDFLQLQTLDEDFFINLNEKIKQIIDSLEKRELTQYAEEVQVLLTVCNKVRDEWLGNEQKTKDTITDSDNMKKKLKEAFELSQKYKDIIEQLKQEIEIVKKQTDTAELREQEVQDKLRKANEKVEHLENILQKYTQKANEFGCFGLEQKENIIEERDRLLEEVKELNKRLQQQRLHINEIEGLNSEMEEKQKELHHILDNNYVTILKEKKLVESLSKEKCSLEEEMKSAHEKLKTIKAQNTLYIQNSVKQNLRILAQKANFERIKTQYNNTSAKLTKALTEIENLKYEKDGLTTLLEQKLDILKTNEEECSKLKQELKEYAKSKDSYYKRLQQTEKEKELLEKNLTKLKNEFLNMKKETDYLKKSVENLNKQIKQLTDERDTLKKTLITKNNRINEYEENIKILQYQIKSLNEDLNNQKLLEKKQHDNIIKMKSEIDKHLKQTQLLDNKISTLQDEIHLKNVIIMDLKRNIEDDQTKIASLKANLEMIRNDKISLQQNLSQIIEDKKKLEDQLQICYENIKKLKENILKKDMEISKNLGIIDRLEKEHNQMKTEITNTHIIYQGTRCELKEKKQENNKIYKTLAECEISLSKIKKEYDKCMHEKNILLTQLNKKEEEIFSQKHQIDKLQNDIDRNQLNYEKSLCDIHNLKIEIKNLKSERTIIKRSLENTSEVRTEIVQLQRILNQEMIKNKALENEMITPLNVHRWRILAGSDPEKMDLINTNQTLQKTILSQRAKVLKKDEALEYSHKLYQTLKEFMLKLPSYKIQEQLNETQATLNKNNKKIKSLIAELNAKDIDDKSKDCMIKELRTNLENTKRQLIDEKKKKQELIEERQIIARMQMQCFSAPPLPYTRAAGNGFKMNVLG